MYYCKLQQSCMDRRDLLNECSVPLQEQVGLAKAEDQEGRQLL